MLYLVWVVTIYPENLDSRDSAVHILNMQNQLFYSVTGSLGSMISATDGTVLVMVFPLVVR